MLSGCSIVFCAGAAFGHVPENAGGVDDVGDAEAPGLCFRRLW